MYGVIENLQQTIEQLELERDNRSIEISAPTIASESRSSELVVEVLSAGSDRVVRDREVKRKLYAIRGVQKLFNPGIV